MPVIGKGRRWQERLREEIHELSDPELVQAAFDEYWAYVGDDQAIDARERLEIYKDLCNAEDLLTTKIVLSKQGRGRLRSFLLNSRARRERW